MNPENLYSAIGARIRAYREKLGLSQEALADAAGLVRTSISNIESGRQRVQVHTLYSIAEALQRRVAEILPAFDAGDDAIAALKAAGEDLGDAERKWISRVVGDEK